jgi:hypothetical protein
MPPYINLSGYVQVYDIRDGFPHCDSLATMDVPFQVGYSCWATESHPGDVLVFPEKVSSRGRPAVSATARAFNQQSWTARCVSKGTLDAGKPAWLSRAAVESVRGCRLHETRPPANPAL